VSKTARLLLVVLLALAGARTANASPVAFPMAPSSLLDVKVPASWAGVWVGVDSTYDAMTGELLGVGVTRDTLVAGQSTDADGATCTGSATDAQIVFDCTTPESDGCGRLAGGFYRTGAETAHVAFTAWQPSACGAGDTVWSIRVSAWLTRDGVPALRASWGALKLRYR